MVSKIYYFTIINANLNVVVLFFLFYSLILGLTSRPSSSSLDRREKQYVVLTSERRSHVVLLPSQTGLYRNIISDTSYAVKADVSSVKDLGKWFSMKLNILFFLTDLIEKKIPASNFFYFSNFYNVIIILGNECYQVHFLNIVAFLMLFCHFIYLTPIHQSLFRIQLSMLYCNWSCEYI